MPLDFPSSPTTGAVWTGTNGINYYWDGSKWTLQSAAGPYLPLSITAPTSVTNRTGGGVMTPYPNVGDFYISPDSWALTGELTIRGQPYGGYDSGVLLSMVATTLPIQSSRAGIFAPNGPSGIASYSTLDQVGIYDQVGSCPPPLKLTGVTYDATHIYPHPALTAAQMNLLRLNMWVYTNSINPAITLPTGYFTENHYTSYVVSWAADGSSIQIGGWAVPGSGNGAAGQVPSTTYDAGTSGTICYFGLPTNVFCGNFVCHHDPVTYPDARSRAYQGIEFDFVNYSTVDYQMAAYGISMDYGPTNNAKATKDSYAIKASGFPTGLILNYISNGVDPVSAITMLTDGFNVHGFVSPVPWAGALTYNVISETFGQIDSDAFWLKTWVQRDVNGTGYTSGSFRMGVLYNPTADFSLAAAATMANLTWSPQGFLYGFRIETGTHVPAITVDAAGGVVVGPNVALATNQVNGFFSIPFCAGAPTGVPQNRAIGAQLIYDTTNHKLWCYDNGTSTWKGVVLT